MTLNIITNSTQKSKPHYRFQIPTTRMVISSAAFPYVCTCSISRAAILQAVGAVGTANTYIGVFIIMYSVVSMGMLAVMTQNIGAGRPGIACQAKTLGLWFNGIDLPQNLSGIYPLRIFFCRDQPPYKDHYQYQIHYFGDHCCGCNPLHAEVEMKQKHGI